MLSKNNFPPSFISSIMLFLTQKGIIQPINSNISPKGYASGICFVTYILTTEHTKKYAYSDAMATNTEFFQTSGHDTYEGAFTIKAIKDINCAVGISLYTGGTTPAVSYYKNGMKITQKELLDTTKLNAGDTIKVSSNAGSGGECGASVVIMQL